MLNVGIAGASGYTGIQLCELLQNHPEVVIKSIYANKNAGKHFSTVCPHFVGLDSLTFESLDPNASYSHLDVLFLALPHATSHAFLDTVIKNNPCLTIIDLSADFRLSDSTSFSKYYGIDHQSENLLEHVVYGLPELNRESLKDTKYAAIPGCYATTCILGLKPLVDAGLTAGRIIIDAKSGVSGAGKSLNESLLFCEVNESFSAYKSGAHRHQAEFDMVFPNESILFSPHLIPQNRGILASIYVDNSNAHTQDEILNVYESAYKNEPFIRLVDTDSPSTRFAVGSNYCAITPKVIDNGQTIAIFSATDNLIKGAAGQAVQVFNIMHGFEERMCLMHSPRMI